MLNWIVVNLSFSLSHNKLSEIPFGFFSFSALRSLNINYNSLTAVPADIGNMTSLVSITMINNKLPTIPTEFAGLVNLNYLHILLFWYSFCSYHSEHIFEEQRVR